MRRKRRRADRRSRKKTTFTYYADLAIAFGEGPASISRIWGDSKIIYSSLPGDQSDFPVGDYPVWNSTTTYNPDNLVAYKGQVYQCVTANTNVTPNPVIPTSGTIYWEVASSYPPWQSGISYQQGQTVSYQGGIYVATQSAPGGPPGSGDWESISQYYGMPTIYPGDQLQGIDPDIQASETSAYTPAFRGLCYFKWKNFPLLNFGNRIPNFRGDQLRGERFGSNDRKYRREHPNGCLSDDGERAITDDCGDRRRAL